MNKKLILRRIGACLFDKDIYEYIFIIHLLNKFDLDLKY